MGRKNSLLDNPSKKQASIVFFIWFTGIVLSIIGATNFFTESLFNKENLSLVIINIGSTITMMPVCINYLKNRIGKEWIENNA